MTARTDPTLTLVTQDQLRIGSRIRFVGFQAVWEVKTINQDGVVIARWERGQVSPHQNFQGWSSLESNEAYAV